MNSEEYFQTAEKIYELIATEIKKAETSNELNIIYPKLVVMYEFFRYIRGESFDDTRPLMGDLQKKLYEMEDSIAKSLENLKEKVDLNDSSLKFQVDQILTPYLK